MAAIDLEVYELREWGERILPSSVRLTDADRRVVDELRGKSDEDRRLVIDELVSGIRIKASSWIGVVRFSAFELRVIPKLVGDQLGVLQILAYAGGISDADFLRSTRSIHADVHHSLVDLVCLILADHCDRLIRGGLLQSYVPRQDALPAIRGRLDLLLQVTKRFGQVAPLECRFEDFNTDILENRMLAAALGAARRVAREPFVQSRVGVANMVLSEAADSAGFDLEDADNRLDYDRRNEHYRAAHYWARVLLRGLGVHDLYRSGIGQSYAFLFDMNVLFEDFVSRIVSDAFANSGVLVYEQHRDSSVVINAATNRSYAAIRPDLLLEEQGGGRRRVPVDAKYKLYDNRKIDPSDIYQTFFYGYAYGRPGEIAHAAIVYPSDRPSTGALLRVMGTEGHQGAEIRAVALDVPSLLTVLRTNADSPWKAALRATLLGAPPVQSN